MAHDLLGCLAEDLDEARQHRIASLCTARIEQTMRCRLGEAIFAEAALEGTRTSWSPLVMVTLAS
ncbi:hypothetical protein AB0J84_32245 [Micromonospora arborensis]|uniref:hypothetical protein n=1 Tax=Micromonospora arborensis TaxID=2116518 RepID=UPI00342F0017